MCFDVPASCTSVLFSVSFVSSTVKLGNCLKASLVFRQSPSHRFNGLHADFLGHGLSLETQLFVYKVTEE